MYFTMNILYHIGVIPHYTRENCKEFSACSETPYTLSRFIPSSDLLCVRANLGHFFFFMEEKRQTKNYISYRNVHSLNFFAKKNSIEYYKNIMHFCTRLFIQSQFFAFIPASAADCSASCFDLPFPSAIFSLPKNTPTVNTRS